MQISVLIDYDFLNFSKLTQLFWHFGCTLAEKMAIMKVETDIFFISHMISRVGGRT